VKVEYDGKADAVYFRIKDADIASTRELEENIIVDVDAAGKLVGIELLFVSDYLRPEDIRSLTVTELPASA
jgi:uncharacterized protein YuzE